VSAPPTSWPWADLRPADFTAAPDPNAMPMPTHTLTATQAAALGITPFQGGFQNLRLVAPDKIEALSLASAVSANQYPPALGGAWRATRRRRATHSC
jgi:hypothetical protein